jgi:glycopeptide antibiotics resistance protein
VTLVIAIVHLVAVAFLAVGPLPTDPDAIAAARDAARLDHNGVPFATITGQLSSGPDASDTVQLVGNLLLLAPLGMYGPALFRSLRSWPALVALAALVSTTIEIGQLGLSEVYGFPIRIADVDDVILNTFGALLGYIAWKLWSWGTSMEGNRAVRRSAD